jgi:hypothetical protein
MVKAHGKVARNPKKSPTFRFAFVEFVESISMDPSHLKVAELLYFIFDA